VELAGPNCEQHEASSGLWLQRPPFITLPDKPSTTEHKISLSSWWVLVTFAVTVLPQIFCQSSDISSFNLFLLEGFLVPPHYCQARGSLLSAAQPQPFSGAQHCMLQINKWRQMPSSHALWFYREKMCTEKGTQQIIIFYNSLKRMYSDFFYSLS